ncbi:unnamed protein product, partial [Musa hybrid cultivar]
MGAKSLDLIGGSKSGSDGGAVHGVVPALRRPHLPPQHPRLLRRQPRSARCRGRGLSLCRRIRLLRDGDLPRGRARRRRPPAPLRVTGRRGHRRDPRGGGDRPGELDLRRQERRRRRKGGGHGMRDPEGEEGSPKRRGRRLGSLNLGRRRRLILGHTHRPRFDRSFDAS